MFCESCGAQMPNDGVFCATCGAKAGEPTVRSAVQRIPSTEIADKAKAASRDAVEAIKLFALDPTGGLMPAFQNLDKQRALATGTAFALIFDLCLLFGVYRSMAIMQKEGDSFGVLGLLGLGGFAPESPSFIKLFIFGLVPFAGFVVALFLARLVFRGQGAAEGDVFTAGAALLPSGFLILASTLLGFANVEVIAVLSLFAFTYTILIIFTGCTRIAQISDAGSAVAVPLVLLVSVYVGKVIFSSLWSAGVAS